MTALRFLLAFLLFYGQSLFAQQDSLTNTGALFRLTAEDMNSGRKLVESALNRRTTTAAQISQFASEAPATVYVVSKEQIQRRGYECLLDILDDIPEVEIHRYASPEFNQHIGLRGVAGNEKFLILQDGVRISAPTGDTHSVGFNFAVEHAEQVEVIIGPASALYGADAFSGIIQIITQEGQDAGGYLKTSYGRYGTTHNSASLSWKNDDFYFNLNGIFYHSQEPDFPSLYTEDFQWYQERYQPSGELLISPFLKETVVPSYGNENRVFEMPTTSWFGNINARFRDLELSYTRHYDSYSSSGSTRPEYGMYTKDARFAYFIETIFGRHRFGSRDLKWLLESTFSFHTYQLDPETAFINTYTGYEPGYKMEFGKSKKWEERLRYDLAPNSNLIAGFTYETLDDLPLSGDLPKKFSFDQPADLQDQYYLGSNVIDKDGKDLSIQQDFFYLHYLNLGAYLQMQSGINPGLHLTAGLRYDLNTRYGQSFNPRLGLVWKPTPEWTIKMLYGESLLSPSPRKSNSHYGSFFPELNDQGEVIGLRSNFFHLSNPDLETEKLRSLEGSLRYVLSNNLVFSINGYYTRINNLINKFSFNPAITSFKGVPVAFVETGANEGEAEIFGATFKLDGVYNLSNVMGVNFYLSYSYSDGSANEESLLFNARNQFKAGLEWTHRRFSISPRVLYRGVSYGLLKDENGHPIGTDPYTVVNLYMRAKLVNTEDWTLALFTRIDNLFDHRYYNAFIGGAEGFARVPQRPRIWTVGGKMEW